VCTCAKPDPETSPSLHELVTQFQTHHCNKYCTKVYKQNNKFYKKCRIGFPRPSKTELQLNDVIDCLAVNSKKQPRKRLHNLARKMDESDINDYTSTNTLASNALSLMQQVNQSKTCHIVNKLHIWVIIVVHNPNPKY